MERGKWVRLAVVLFLALLSFGVASVAYVSVSTVREEIFRGLAVYYRPSLPFTSPYMFVGFVNESGHGLDVCVSVYGLMPNGSVGFLGYTCGRGGVSLDYGSVKSYASSWRRALAARGNNPDNVEPGLILLGTALDSEAAYPFIKGIPVDTGLVQKGYTVTTEIKLNTKNMPKISKTQIQQIVTQAKQLVGVTGIQAATGAQEFPPREILERCIPIRGEWEYVVCFIWELNRIYYVGTNIGIPLSMVHLRGSTSPNEIYLVNDVFMHEHLEANSRLGVYVNFAGGAAVKLGSPILRLPPIYKSDLYTFTLKGDNVYLDYTHRVFPDHLGSLSREGFISAVGFIGNYSIATYDYYYYIFGVPWPPWYLRFKLGNATLAIAVPVLENNKMKDWTATDTNPTDGKGLDPIFNLVARNWAPVGNTTSQTGIDFYSYEMVRQVAGIDLLSLAIPILVEGVPITLPLTASVGLSQQNQLFTATDAHVTLKSVYFDKSYIYANFYRSPVRYEWDNNYYYIPASYIKATTKGVPVDYVQPPYFNWKLYNFYNRSDLASLHGGDAPLPPNATDYDKQFHDYILNATRAWWNISAGMSAYIRDGVLELEPLAERPYVRWTGNYTLHQGCPVGLDRLGFAFRIKDVKGSADLSMFHIKINNGGLITEVSVSAPRLRPDGSIDLQIANLGPNGTVIKTEMVNLRQNAWYQLFVERRNVEAENGTAVVVTLTIKNDVGVPICMVNLMWYYVESDWMHWYTTLDINFDSNTPYTIDLDWLGADLYPIPCVV
ncbi:MAG: hypothetical protein LM573_05600 [Thermofilum sp.]|nr:hypothetical protein [Thermofilum sp.]